MVRTGANRRASPVGAFFVFCIGIAMGAWPQSSPATALCAPDHIDQQVRVSHVIDGDTVLLSDGRHLRFIGVNTPELLHNGAPPQAYGIEARNQLRQLLSQHQSILNLRFDVERQDRYNRVLAHAFLTDGRSISAWLESQGLGTVLVVPPNVWNSHCYAATEQQARHAQRGIWALPAYRVVESTQLPASARDYHLIAGRVRHVGNSRYAVWLDLEGGVALRIERDDLHYFSDWHLQDLLGKRVLARGWLHREKNELRMNIRHPSALQVIKS